MLNFKSLSQNERLFDTRIQKNDTVEVPLKAPSQNVQKSVIYNGIRSQTTVQSNRYEISRFEAYARAQIFPDVKVCEKLRGKLEETGSRSSD